MANTDVTLARDIMSTALITLKVGDTVEEALKVLIQNKITGLPVVNGSGKMVGVLSELDLIRQISRFKTPKAEVFQEVIEFTANPEGVQETAPLEEIVEKLVGAKFRRLPVVNKSGKLVGIITRRDLMRLYFYRAKLT